MKRNKNKDKAPVTVISQKVIPQIMKDSDTWVNWMNIEKKGGMTKAPCDGRCNVFNANDKENQMSFEKALENTKTNQHIGIGFVFNEESGFLGVDMDECVDKEGELKEEAKSLVDDCGAYTEWSPSKKGLHLYFYSPEYCKELERGEYPPTLIKSKVLKNVHGSKKVEIYSSGRFFTVTGNLHSEEIEEEWISDNIHRLESQLGINLEVDPFDQSESSSKEHTPPRDRINIDNPVEVNVKAQELIRSLKEERSDLKELLESGDWEKAGYSSQSEADLGVCKILLKRVNEDENSHLIVDQAFSLTSLYRDKWNETRGEDDNGNEKTYSQMTIQQAQIYIDGEKTMTESKQTQQTQNISKDNSDKKEMNIPFGISKFPDNPKRASQQTIKIQIKEAGTEHGKGLRVESMASMLGMIGKDGDDYLLEYILPKSYSEFLRDKETGDWFVSIPQWLFIKKREELLNKFTQMKLAK